MEKSFMNIVSKRPKEEWPLHGRSCNTYVLRPAYSEATQLNSTSSWVELCRYKRAFRVYVSAPVLTGV